MINSRIIFVWRNIIISLFLSTITSIIFTRDFIVDPEWFFKFHNRNKLDNSTDVLLYKIILSTKKKTIYMKLISKLFLVINKIITVISLSISITETFMLNSYV